MTQQLTRLYDAGRRFHFVEQAHRLLCHVPQAGPLASQVLSALTELGLGGPARELLQMRRDLAVVGQDLAELTTKLESLPNGRVPWTDCVDVFARNMAALLRHRPHLAWLQDSVEAVRSKVQLYRTIEGHHHLSRRRQAGQLREWLPSLTDEGDEANAELPPPEKLGAAALIGVRIGTLIQRVQEQTHRLYLNYSHPLYLLEPDVSRFVAWLHVTDHTGLLDDDRVYVFVGPTSVDDLQRLLLDVPNLRVPTTHVSLCPDPSVADMVRRAVERVLAERNAELSRLIAAVAMRYRDRDLSYWVARMAQPGCALAITSRYTTMLQYSARDALHALEELGYRTSMVIEEKDHYQTSQIDACRRILELDPDFVLVFDHLRYEYPHVPGNVPLLAWVQDPMDNLFCREAGASIGSHDFVCGYFRERCCQEFGYPEDRYIDTDIPVSNWLFHDGDLDAETMSKYGCDLSFVSNASTSVPEFYAEALPTYPEAYQPLLTALYPNATSIGDSTEHPLPVDAARALVRSTAAELGISLKEGHEDFIATNFVYRLFDWGSRQEALEWAADWAKRTGRVFKIYGRGWERHPTLSDFAAGVIEHGEPLRCAYRASKLALQLIPSGFRHQRSYELLASGTLPLSRYCPLDFEGPEPNGENFPKLERIAFRSREEFEALLERFLADEPYRQEVLTELRAVVLSEFTYSTTMQTILDKWRTSMSERLSAACLSPTPQGVA